MSELANRVFEQVLTPLVGAIILLVVFLFALIQRVYGKRIDSLQESLKLRDAQIADLQSKLRLSAVGKLRVKVAGLQAQPRRRLTPQQKTLLAEHAKVPAGRRFTLEIIHDMAGSDCSAYANDFRNLFDEIGGWAPSRSAVLRPGWIARCGLGVHVQSRDLLSRPETVILNALAAAGVDYDLVRIPDLEADVGLIVTPAPAKHVEIVQTELPAGASHQDIRATQPMMSELSMQQLSG